MDFTVIRPDINDIAAEMIEYGFSGGQPSMDYHQAREFERKTGVRLAGTLKNISYKDAHTNAQMRILERELEPFFESAWAQTEDMRDELDYDDW